MKKEIKFNKLTLGVCYYPEHWEKKLWHDDLSRMEKCGIEIIRIGEFAWTIFEPREGVYNFNLFDEFLEVVKKHRIRVIFGTPTATPPIWLTEKYPECLNAANDGTLFRHGMRRHYTYNSPVYNEFTKKIVTQLAKHYGHESVVAGWQIDNELNCEVDEFYSESDHKAFREFLKRKYKTLEKLNVVWGTTFWNQIYTDWNQVYLKRPNACHSANPHLALDEKRFFSDSCIRYCKLQYDILKKYINKEQFVTTNGMFAHVDSHEMTETALDFFMYDSYPDFGYSQENPDQELRDRKWSFNLSKVRSVCPNFGIMEQQSGPNGWVNRMLAASPKPGQMRLWTFQSVAHGADFISYFRWRTCSFGTEIYWHGLNDYSNQPNRRIKELQQIWHDFKKVYELAGTKYHAEIALIRDYDNEWDGELDKWHGSLTSYSDRSWFKASTYTHTPMDAVQMRKNTDLKELCQYKLLIYPHAAILTKQTADLLGEYVKAGGILVLGARTGYKDEYGHCPMVPQPGPVKNLCGVQIEDFTVLLPEDNEIRIDVEGNLFGATLFQEVLKPMPESHVLGYYRGGSYDGAPAVIENTYGRGKTVYYGSVFNRSCAEKLLERYGLRSPYDDEIDLEECCELAVRVTNEKSFLFVLNFSVKETNVIVKKPMKELLSEKTIMGKVGLEGFGVMIFEREQDKN